MKPMEREDWNRRYAAPEFIFAARIAFQVADLRGGAMGMVQFNLAALIYLRIPQPELAPILTRAMAPGGTFLLVGYDPANLEHGHDGPQDPSVPYTAYSYRVFRGKVTGAFGYH